MHEDGGTLVPAISTAEADELRKRILNLLKLVAERESVCQACRTRIWFVKMTKSGKLNPFTAEGVSHFSDCAAAKEFRRG